jgi:hypothetical protein
MLRLFAMNRSRLIAGTLKNGVEGNGERGGEQMEHSRMNFEGNGERCGERGTWGTGNGSHDYESGNVKISSNKPE